MPSPARAPYVGRTWGRYFHRIAQQALFGPEKIMMLVFHIPVELLKTLNQRKRTAPTQRITKPAYTPDLGDLRRAEGWI